MPTTTETSAATSGTRMRFSDNVPVHSMLFDAPQTDCLPPTEATAFAVVLQEAIDYLEILESVIPARVNERWDESYRTIDEMYGRSEEPIVMFREEMGLLPVVPTVSEKIQRDRLRSHFQKYKYLWSTDVGDYIFIYLFIYLFINVRTPVYKEM